MYMHKSELVCCRTMQFSKRAQKVLMGAFLLSWMIPGYINTKYGVFEWQKIYSCIGFMMLIPFLKIKKKYLYLYSSIILWATISLFWGQKYSIDLYYCIGEILRFLCLFLMLIYLSNIIKNEKDVYLFLKILLILALIRETFRDVLWLERFISVKSWYWTRKHTLFSVYGIVILFSFTCSNEIGYLKSITLSIPFIISLIIFLERTAWIGLFLGISFISLLVAINNRVKVYKVVKIIVAIIFISIFCIGFINKNFPSFSEAIYNRFMTLANLNSIASGDISRVGQYAIAWEIIKDRPLIGVGIGNFINCAPMYLNKVQYPSQLIHTNVEPHNFYLLMASELGIVGLIWAIYISFSSSFIVLRHAYKKQYKNLSVLLSSAGLCGASLSFFMFYHKEWFIIANVILVIADALGKE